MLSEVRLPGVPTAIDLHLMPDWRVFGLTVIVVLGSTMVSSLGPALRISSGLSIVKTLKTDSRASAAGGATTWRMLLIAGQATTAVLLLVVGGLALRSLLAVIQVDPGFERGASRSRVSPRRWSATTRTRRITTCRPRPPPSGSFQTSRPQDGFSRSHCR